MFLHEYYLEWIQMYKEGAVSRATLQKYYMTQQWIKKIVPKLDVKDITRMEYQRILNIYAKYHEKQTVMDFHGQIKSAILDAVDEGLIEKNPTRKIVIKGRPPAKNKKIKYLSQRELQKLLEDLKLTQEISWDWLILLIAKTGIRFAEALAITPKDFNFLQQDLYINKTWNYKEDGGFAPTKNKTSMRKIKIDYGLASMFSGLIKTLNLPDEKPIFVPEGKKIYNSTLNDILERHCKKIKIPIISIHGLRHTHASILLQEGVSISSIANRLGHSNITTTQKVYVHLIREMENKDNDSIMRCMSRFM